MRIPDEELISVRAAAQLLKRAENTVRHMFRVGALTRRGTFPAMVAYSEVQKFLGRRKTTRKYFIGELDGLRERVQALEADLKGAMTYLLPRPAEYANPMEQIQALWHRTQSLLGKQEWYLAELAALADAAMLLTSLDLVRLAQEAGSPDAWLQVLQVLLEGQTILEKDPDLAEPGPRQVLYAKLAAGALRVENAGMTLIFSQTPELHELLGKRVKAELGRLPVLSVRRTPVRKAWGVEPHQTPQEGEAPSPNAEEEAQPSVSVAQISNGASGGAR